MLTLELQEVFNRLNWLFNEANANIKNKEEF